ncbi:MULTISPECIES: 3-oxoacyl-[acyl-carrier-protein] synthase III C-terminal domain-containing protein [Streptomyces]|uniref:3-oxoacyl-[acyl-carrier-protein] synthase III C-terminal domain-containing protein n=1 Tax=Streptomyces TaxID=1883 RepID=UPI001E59BD38|nr:MULTISPECIES: 3-oxoacyl-[acyl-carrier-protein] synthase III C-terminal domain-containing protein [Streptomyces]UFQ13566.1 hypothetical protein J2N69_00185 [Streptomyces huasconensis]WCL83163.1 3-oxoacyl-[acyl-carrier-protein] synthase III C-terminal domain-containing protein [Streptomyces sp. JCM 35825]
MTTDALPFPYAVTGSAVELSDPVPIAAWAEQAKIPHRKHPGTTLDGAQIEGMLGVRSKSWDRERFAGLGAVSDTAREVLAATAAAPADLDAVFVVTCSPHQVMMDQDAFTLMRTLGIPDHIPPLQLGAGCAGVARAAALLARSKADRALILAYNLASTHTTDAEGQVRPHYLHNDRHPYGAGLWSSPALFSDAAAAMVLERDENADGVLIYSRDSQHFGDGPGLSDPLVHYPGGGAGIPPGDEAAADMSCYGMNAKDIRPYYTKAMTLNHHDLEHARPGYLDQVRRLYTHQANPALVATFHDWLGLGPDKAPSNAARLGNTVSPSTIALLQEDCANSAVEDGDLVCFSVVGSGPERGAFLAPVRLSAPAR